MLTVNEIFCRHDYPADPGDVVCVDFGSNIGISAAWFLSRSPLCRAYLFEPYPPNVTHLKENLVRFEGRYSLQPVAVGLLDGEVEFGFEQTGRYGGIGLIHHGQTMRVPCVDSNRVLEDVLSRHAEIDILKIDIEALEREVVERIPAAFARRIRKIYVEGRFATNPLAPSHAMRYRGSITAFVRTS